MNGIVEYSVSNQRIGTICLVLTAFCTAVQLWMGCDEIAMFWDSIGLSMGFFVLRSMRSGSFASWLLFYYIAGQTFVALLMKTGLRQTIESHLYAPVPSYTLEFIGIMSLCAAIMLASKANMGRPLVRPELDPRRLGIIKWCCVCVGAASWILTGSVTGDTTYGLRGISQFNALLYLAIICKTAQLIIQTDGRKLIDLELTVQLILNCGLGMLSNSKGGVVSPLISYLATVFFFTGRLPMRIILPAFVFAAIFVAFIGPLIHVLRFLGEPNMGFYPRIVLVTQTIASLLEGGQYARLQSDIGTVVGSEYYNYFGTYANWKIVGDRYASIQQIDPAVWRVYHHGTVDLPVIMQPLRSLVPQLINHNKPPFPMSYYVLSELGFLTPGAGKFPTLPMIGELYAAHGLAGTFVYSFLIFLLLLGVVKKTFVSIGKNVFGIFIFVYFIIGYGSQGEIEQYLGFIFRELPSYIVLFWLFGALGARRIIFTRTDAVH